MPVFIDRGIELPLESQATTTRATRAAAGLDVQKRIVRDGIVDQLYADAPDDAAHFQRYLSANCFGDFLTRDGLDLKTRELVTFSFLVSLGGAESQVKGHVAANLNIGNTRQELISGLTVLVPFVGYPRTLNGLSAVNAVIEPARRNNSSDPPSTR